MFVWLVLEPSQDDVATSIDTRIVSALKANHKQLISLWKIRTTEHESDSDESMTDVNPANVTITEIDDNMVENSRKIAKILTRALNTSVTKLTEIASNLGDMAGALRLQVKNNLGYFHFVVLIWLGSLYFPIQLLPLLQKDVVDHMRVCECKATIDSTIAAHKASLGS
jgi:hypothetical protein